MSEGHEAPALAPRLTISIPTYNRPARLTRALGSVTSATPEALQGDTEVIVSDNSTDERSELVYKELTADWRGPTTYRRNTDAPGMVGNFNRCIELASGRFVVILHDDDYLLPSAVADLHAAVARAGDQKALLFGVRVVDDRGRTLRSQTHRPHDLPAAAAVRRVLRHSSFVRFPAIAVRRDAYTDLGGFDESFGGQTDVDMWTRLFSRHGVRCERAVTACYVVHEEADTTGVFVPETLRRVDRVFRWASSNTPLSEDTVRRCKADFMHQFILGGTVRRLRLRDAAGARTVMGLFDEPVVRNAGLSWRWAPVRLILRATLRAVPSR